MSASPLVTAGVMIAGFTYPADERPLKKLEFRKVPMEFPFAPSKKSRSPLNGSVDVVAAFVAADTGEVSWFNDEGIVEVSCCSCDCTPDPMPALVACVTADDWAA
jgi:hypothetical protein